MNKRQFKKLNKDVGFKVRKLNIRKGEDIVITVDKNKVSAEIVSWVCENIKNRYQTNVIVLFDGISIKKLDVGEDIIISVDKNKLINDYELIDRLINNIKNIYSNKNINVVLKGMEVN